MKPIELRLARLERATGTCWEAFRHVPVEQWPDVALWAFLGLPESTSDAELQRIIALPGSLGGNVPVQAGGRT